MYLDAIGFEDHRAETAHTSLLQEHVSTADPAVLGTLRLTIGTTWRSPAVDLAVLTRLASERGDSPSADAMLEVLANNIAATYDNQPMQYTSDHSETVVDAAIVAAAIHLGGPDFAPRNARPGNDNDSHSPQTANDDAPAILKRLVATQQPEAPEGRAGAIVIAHALDSHRYRDDPAPAWDADTAANLIGYRILEITLAEGADAGIALIDDIAREIPTFSRNDIFADLGQGLAARAAHADYAEYAATLETVTSYCLTTAYQRIRGGGGWRQFAGRERQQLWVQAHRFHSGTAERVLAAAVTNRVNAGSYGSYGSSQGLVAAFAARPASTPGGTPVDCWDAAHAIISRRLPGTAHTGGHTYRPTPFPDSPADLNLAMAILALSTIAQPTRDQIRVALVATGFLLTLRPAIAQKAIAALLQSGLDAGRITWLLEAIRTHVPSGALVDDLANELTELAKSHWLSVRHHAGQILLEHGRPVPDPPATEPTPQVRAAIHAALDPNHVDDE